MSWYYQARKFEDNGREYWQVIEVYSEGRGITGPIAPGGDTKEELLKELRRMIRDVKKYGPWSNEFPKSR